MFSEGLQIKSRKVNIGFVPKRGETLSTGLFKLKQKNGFKGCKDVVFSVPCARCGPRYLGETGQYFCERRKQHQHGIRNKKTTNVFL